MFVLKLLMAGFEPRPSGVGSDHWPTINAQDPWAVILRSILNNSSSALSLDGSNLFHLCHSSFMSSS